MRESNPAEPGQPSVAERLEQLLEALTLEHERLDALADRRAGAIASANLTGLGECVAEESAAAQRIAALEEERRRLLDEAAPSLGLEDPASTTISQVAERMPAPERGRLTDAALRLRTLIERVHTKNQSSGMAAERLARHMEGVIRAAEGWLSHARTYGRGGMVAAGPTVCSALDLTT